MTTHAKNTLVFSPLCARVTRPLRTPDRENPQIAKLTAFDLEFACEQVE